MGGSGPPLQPTVPVDDPEDQALQLLIWEPAGGTRQLRLEPGVITVGRAGADVDVAVDDPAVSRLHARLFVDEVLEVEDAESSNGTFVGGKRVPPSRHVTVAFDEPVVVGSTTLIVRRGTTTTAPDEPSPVYVPRDVRPLVDKIVGTRWAVLIVGETGTGKTALAQWLHKRSRIAGRLVEVACRGTAESQLQDELFGSGAVGAFDRARGGTLVLDEISDMPLPVQDALIRALESTGEQDAPRIIATSRIGPAEAVRLGVLRKELRYRLSAVTLVLPPLRERRGEVKGLADTMLEEVVRERSLSSRSWGPDAVALFEEHAWPGNLRELGSVIRGAALGSDATQLGAAELRAWLVDAVPKEASERETIVAALASCGGNQSAAAKLLGISRGTLVARIRKYGLTRPRKR